MTKNSRKKMKKGQQFKVPKRGCVKGRSYKVKSVKREERRWDDLPVWQRHSFSTGSSSSDKPIATA